jgi:hypothetical protein
MYIYIFNHSPFHDAAFMHQIPDDGNLFVLFAPHVGISKMGKVGEYSRLGQKIDGKACGAASGIT